jgi:hypothetical protein
VAATLKAFAPTLCPEVIPGVFTAIRPRLKDTCRKRLTPLNLTTTMRKFALSVALINSSGSCVPFCVVVEEARTVVPVELSTYRS